MGPWPILIVMTTLAVALLVLPFLARSERRLARRDYDLEVFRAQLRELERDQESGLIGDEEARAARVEVERRMLTAAAQVADTGAANDRGRLPAAAAVVVGLPVIAVGVYAYLGSPEQPAAPFADRADERRQVAEDAADGEAMPPVDTMIARIEQRVAENPDDLEGWFRLGRAYALTQRFDQAVEAYRRAIALDDDVAELHASLGEALVMHAEGIVGPDARVAFERAIEISPDDPRARFYTGLAELQGGDRRAALDLWVALIEDTPADAPWLTDLRQRTAGLAEELGLDPEEVLPAAPPVTAAAPATGAATRAAAEELEAALIAEPKDWEGWIRLARAWTGLGEEERARDALARGADVYSGAPFVQQQFQAAAQELGLAPANAATPGPSAEQIEAAREMPAEDRDQMIRGMVEGLAARLEQEPDDVEGWRMLGRSWRVLGEIEKSAEAYAQVAALLPDDVGAQADHAQALLLLDDGAAAPSAATVAQLRRVLALDDDHPDALFHLGRAAAAAGDTAAAADYWNRLMARLPPDAPERIELQNLLDGLVGDG